jgi:VIT1/CCC1 family predicted Fe2+/Mn2+ transporter
MKTQIKKYLWEFVYGGIDGAITTFAVVAWSVWAGLDASVILILWFANLLADWFSMSIWAYLSSDAEDSWVSKKGRIYTALVTYFSFIILGFIPLIVYVLQYLWVDFSNPFLFASSLTLLSFVLIWYIKSLVANSWFIKWISETLFLWIAAAAVAYYVWDFLEKIITW